MDGEIGVIQGAPDLIPVQDGMRQPAPADPVVPTEIARAGTAEPSLTERLAMRAETLGRNSLDFQAGAVAGDVGGVSIFDRQAPEAVAAVEKGEVEPPSFSDMMSNFNSAYSHAVQVSVLGSGLTGMTRSLNKLMSGN